MPGSSALTEFVKGRFPLSVDSPPPDGLHMAFLDPTGSLGSLGSMGNGGLSEPGVSYLPKSIARGRSRRPVLGGRTYGFTGPIRYRQLLQRSRNCPERTCLPPSADINSTPLLGGSGWATRETIETQGGLFSFD